MIKFIQPLRLILISLLISNVSLFGASLNGNYTINSTLPTGGTNFQSFTSFADSINLNGVSGNVTALVAHGSGPYTEQVVFQNIHGVGPAATVTINGSGETITAITDSTNRHIIRLTDLEYFSITNLRVVRDPASTHATYGIHIFNTGNYISITNCSIDLSGTTSTLNGSIVASGSETSILTTGDFHNLTINNDTTLGGGYGVSVFGLISNLASHIVIADNFIYDFHSNGVYLRETDSAVISGNNFDKRTSNVTSVNAIQIAQAANINANIYNNYIKVSQTSNGTQTFRGIYLFNGTGHKVYNNVISDVQLISGNFTGIAVRTAGTAPEIYFNTISLDNPTASSGDLIGIEEELSNTNSVLRNNIVSISQTTTGMKAGLSLGSTSTMTTALNSNNNLFWTPGGNVAVKGTITPVLYPLLSDWQAVSNQDSSSLSSDPGFTFLTLPVPVNGAVDNAGVSIPSITTDILGNPRGSTPDVGAIEFVSIGISDINAENRLFVYPNPANSKFYISAEGFKSNEVSVFIFDVTGKLVYSEETKLFPGQSDIMIDTEKLVSGHYLIRIITGMAHYSGRFERN